MREVFHGMNPKLSCHSTRNIFNPAFWLALLLAIPATPPLGQAAQMSEQRILKEAERRIEQYRKGDLTLRLIGADGLPLRAGSPVTIEQTRHQFLFGCNLFRFKKNKSPQANAAYEQRFLDLFNYATLPFFWGSTEPRPGHYNYKALDAMLAWCRAHAITPTGHPLCWNAYEPSWLPDDPPRALRLQMDRTTREINRFKGRIGIWYVLNEMSDYQDPERLKIGAKLTRAIKATGAEQYMRQAFTTARAANPEATLIVNDYNLTETYAKQVITKLVDETGRPLYDVIGIQAHQHVQLWTPEETWKTCERFAPFNKPLHISEVTITSGKLGWDLRKKDPSFNWASTTEGGKLQAEAVARFYTVLFSHPAVEAITWWDLSDDQAWTGAPAGLLRADMSTKPAYLALQKLIKGQWWTRLQPNVEEKSLVTLRGYFGDYRVTITDGKGRVQTGSFTLNRSITGILEVRLKTETSLKITEPVN